MHTYIALMFAWFQSDLPGSQTYTCFSLPPNAGLLKKCAKHDNKNTVYKKVVEHKLKLKDGILNVCAHCV